MLEREREQSERERKREKERGKRESENERERLQVSNQGARVERGRERSFIDNQEVTDGR
jgi:hypothetical protein